MPNHYFVSGEWNLICDICAIKYKANKSKKRWDGFIVCPNCYEQRHPQDFVKTRQDKITVPYIRPINDSVFIATNYLTYINDGYWSPLNYTESVLY